MCKNSGQITWTKNVAHFKPLIKTPSLFYPTVQGEVFQNTSWVNHFETQSIEIGDLSPDLYQFKTVARNDFPNTENRQESPASDVTEGRPLPGVVSKFYFSTVLYKSNNEGA